MLLVFSFNFWSLSFSAACACSFATSHFFPIIIYFIFLEIELLINKTEMKEKTKRKRWQKLYKSQEETDSLLFFFFRWLLINFQSLFSFSLLCRSKKKVDGLKKTFKFRIQREYTRWKDKENKSCGILKAIKRPQTTDETHSRENIKC